MLSPQKIAEIVSNKIENKKGIKYNSVDFMLEQKEIFEKIKINSKIQKEEFKVDIFFMDGQNVSEEDRKLAITNYLDIINDPETKVLKEEKIKKTHQKKDLDTGESDFVINYIIFLYHTKDNLKNSNYNMEYGFKRLILPIQKKEYSDIYRGAVSSEIVEIKGKRYEKKVKIIEDEKILNEKDGTIYVYVKFLNLYSSIENVKEI